MWVRDFTEWTKNKAIEEIIVRLSAKTSSKEKEIQGLGRRINLSKSLTE